MRHVRLALVLLASLPLAAQHVPDFRGAVVTTVRAAGDLRQQIVSLDSANERVWVGYTIPASRARPVRVCCSLDDENTQITTRHDDFSEDVDVLYRVNRGEITTIRALSSCSIEAGGAHIYWLDGVDPRASINLLASLAKSDSLLSNKAIFALSLHDGSTDALIDLARHGERAKIRSKALFWLAQTAADKTAGVLRDAVDNDPDEGVRAKAVFGIAQLPNDQSIPLLAELMRTHRSANVRKKAAFWLGQKNDPRALEAIMSFLQH